MYLFLKLFRGIILENNKKISEQLVLSGAYKDLDTPVILTSGELGIYYINTELLLNDSGRWKHFAENPLKMISHSIKTAETSVFGRVIDILAQKVEDFSYDDSKLLAISGGQRRDWPFSGPVAHRLGLPHITLYKNGKIELIENAKINQDIDLSKYQAIHVADLMTKGSSLYDSRQEPLTGWIPMLRNQGICICDVINVVTRLQGGEEAMVEAGVNCSSLVAIDEAFLRENSKYPERALEYHKNPFAWSKKYLAEKGIDCFVDCFNQGFQNFSRAEKFLQVYCDVLKQTGRFNELSEKVEKKYGYLIECL
jgi:orotate phosphoribosyltransferase